MALKPPFLRPGASSPEPHEPTIPAVDEPEDSRRITPRVLYRAVLLAALLVAAGFVLKALLTLLLVVLMTIILALVLSAGATRLARWRVPRALGVLLTLFAIVGVLGGTIALLVPTFVHEVNHFVDSLPTIVRQVLHKFHAITGANPKDVSDKVTKFVKGYTTHPTKLIGPLESIGSGLAGAIAALIVMVITAIYMAISPRPLVDNIVRLAPPPRRAHARDVLERLREAWIGWLRGLIVAMVIIGVLVYVGLEIVGLQFAIFFAVVSALFEVIPYFGAIISGAPAVLLGLTHSPGKALAVAAVFLVAHQVDGNIIGPVVMARAVKLHPAVVAIGVVVVERLFGFLGLLVAVPIISGFLILVDELWAKPMDSRRQGPRSLATPSESPPAGGDSA
jgi:predicted PurR-regulated permease PerM